MTSTPQEVAQPSGATTTPRGTDRGLAARKHLWKHFTRESAYGEGHEVPIITRGEGAYIWDDRGRQYLDGLSGLFVVQAGHGREELAAFTGPATACNRTTTVASPARPSRAVGTVASSSSGRQRGRRGG